MRRYRREKRTTPPLPKLADRPALGEVVSVTAHLVRRGGIWERRDLPAPVNGLYMGWRFKQDTDYEPEYNEWSGSSSSIPVEVCRFPVYLVVQQDNGRAALVVFPDDTTRTQTIANERPPEAS